MEIWKDIKGYEGSYMVSNLGRVKSIPRYRVKKTVYLKENVLKGGYSYLELCLDSVRKKYLVHRLVAIAFIDNPQNKPQVNHKNGVKTDNIVSNLEWNTRSENQQHAIDNGLRKPSRGEINGQCKLREEQVIEIIDKTKNNYSTGWLAKKYNVSPSTISDIKAKRSWKHLHL